MPGYTCFIKRRAGKGTRYQVMFIFTAYDHQFQDTNVDIGNTLLESGSNSDRSTYKKSVICLL